MTLDPGLPTVRLWRSIYYARDLTIRSMSLRDDLTEFSAEVTLTPEALRAVTAADPRLLRVTHLGDTPVTFPERPCPADEFVPAPDWHVLLTIHAEHPTLTDDWVHWRSFDVEIYGTIDELTDPDSRRHPAPGRLWCREVLGYDDIVVTDDHDPPH